MQVVSNQTPAAAAVVPKRPRAGRPPAKHSSPDYSPNLNLFMFTRMSATPLRFGCFTNCKEFSALVEKLLAGWLTIKPSPDLKEIP